MLIHEFSNRALRLLLNGVADAKTSWKSWVCKTAELPHATFVEMVLALGDHDFRAGLNFKTQS